MCDACQKISENNEAWIAHNGMDLCDFCKVNFITEIDQEEPLTPLQRLKINDKLYSELDDELTDTAYWIWPDMNKFYVKETEKRWHIKSYHTSGFQNQVYRLFGGYTEEDFTRDKKENEEMNKKRDERLKQESLKKFKWCWF